MEVKQSYKGTTVYAKNVVTDELVQTVKEGLEMHEYIEVCFDVIGKTRHLCLSQELLRKLGDKYDAEISYEMYGCKVVKRR